MPITATVLRWTVRLTGLLSLLLGLGLWNGAWFNLLGLHQGLGLIMSAALVWLVLLGFVRSVSLALLGLALLCSLALPVVGTLQGLLLPGQNHWLIEVLHPVLGIGAIVLAELIGSRMRARPEPAARRGV
ncbi:hypothetical protein [Deinococcus sp.]|uniref:hypothetical protein n=1 Tax=Deinococcus sp. TaxID=47478 RepID=UPI00286DAEDD|nr:hypothetical protein [Deinococcus sp.]